VIDNGKVLCNLIAGQDVHRAWGGVVPELASRAHQKNIVPLVDAALREAQVSLSDLSCVAFTSGPGLIGSLIVGTCFAKGLALGLGIPLIETNHMEAHILAHFIEPPVPPFPFLCLTVSGGHTMITRVNDYFTHEVIGRSTDDAAGEAFDKAAKLLGLPYPGGPLIDKYAATGNPLAYSFPSPRIPAYDYSFSGLKTAYLYFLRDHEKQEAGFTMKHLPDICASIQHSIVSQLMKKLVQAAKDTGIRHIAIAGGVSANSGLRSAVLAAGESEGWQVYIPRTEYCTDNAAMIGIAAHFRYLKGHFSAQDTAPHAR
jgi:N6-L-threonylcarbamoyladenine synthase